MSLISRKLLTPDEVLIIESPYTLVMLAGKPSVITKIPDISEMYFNKLNGMGTKEENQMLRIQREENREKRPFKSIKIWNIWDKETEEMSNMELIKDRFRKNIKEINEEDIENYQKSIAYSNTFIYYAYV